MKSLIKKLYFCVIVILFGVSIIAGKTASAYTTGTESFNCFHKCYYIATDGSDDNPGTIKKPFASIAKAQEVATSGDTVFIRGGIYKKFSIADTNSLYNYVNEINKSGITYRGYDSEVPVFDFSNITTEKRVCAFYITSNAKDVKFQSIKVTGVPIGLQKQSECFRIEGKNITFEKLTCSDNQAIGFYFTGYATGTCYRCDACNNIGVEGISIGNIDGFGAHGDGVKFKECRSWNNSDDGYDCINSKGANTFDSCWAFNMNQGGDSNGFKVGGWGKKPIDFTPPVHNVKNCIAANNDAHGFYSNHQPGQAATWIHNTAYDNKKGNFYMLECATISDPTDIPGTREVLKYNLSYKNNTLDLANISSENNKNNSWNLAEDDISADNFKSLDVNQLSKDRGSDGALPKITFMKVTCKSKFKGLGCF